MLQEAIAVFRRRREGESKADLLTLEVYVDGANWHHDSESEFYADYRRSTSDFFYRESHYTKPEGRLTIKGYSTDCWVSVEAASRPEIEDVLGVFERNATNAKLPAAKAKQPKIFIGHGRSLQWRELKDHLQDKHEYCVKAYEVGARAGHAIRDIVTEMLDESNFALLLLTAEDEMQDGKMRARQNVIHEAGLFQGRLGFHRAVVLLEEGVEEFSNISGIEQIRFGSGRIRETFGEVLATLKREFQSN